MAIREKNNEISEESLEDGISKSYCVVLANYNGPLDLLLELVKREKIDIEEIFISDITEQYLAAMEQIDELDMEQAADFIVVAATLLEIKSKRLLPKLEEPIVATVEEDDPEQELLMRLKEYKLYKEAAEKMREQEILDMHFRLPDNSVGEPRLVLKDMTANGLLLALKKMFDKIGARQQVFKIKKVDRDPFTVEQKTAFIRERFKYINECTFYELFDDDWTISEVVTTFSALLNLVKEQEVRVVQLDIFEPITIAKRSKENVGN